MVTGIIILQKIFKCNILFKAVTSLELNVLLGLLVKGHLALTNILRLKMLPTERTLRMGDCRKLK